MKDIVRRLSELERLQHPSKVHVVRCDVGGDEQAAIDAYGRERIHKDDLIVVIQQFCGSACSKLLKFAPVTKSTSAICANTGLAEVRH